MAVWQVPACKPLPDAQASFSPLGPLDTVVKLPPQSDRTHSRDVATDEVGRRPKTYRQDDERTILLSDFL